MKGAEMKRILFCMLAMLVVFALVTPAHAFLINRGTDTLGNRLIYDNDLDITWYDFSNAANSWQNQVNWALGLSVTFGSTTYDDWRLPLTVDGLYVFGWDGTTTAGYNITNSEMGHLFYTELGNKGYYAIDGTNPQPGWGLTNTGDFQNLSVPNQTEVSHQWRKTQGSQAPCNRDAPSHYSCCYSRTKWFHHSSTHMDHPPLTAISSRHR